MGQGDGGNNCAILLCHSSVLSTLTLPKNVGSWSSIVSQGDPRPLQDGPSTISQNIFRSRQCSIWLTKRTFKLLSGNRWLVHDRTVTCSRRREHQGSLLGYCPAPQARLSLMPSPVCLAGCASILVKMEGLPSRRSQRRSTSDLESLGSLVTLASGESEVG